MVVVSSVYICYQVQTNEVARTHNINLRGDEIKIRYVIVNINYLKL